jgi:hypothetical protein
MPVFTRVNYCALAPLFPLFSWPDVPSHQNEQADAANGREEGAKKEHGGVADSVPQQSGDDTCH